MTRELTSPVNQCEGWWEQLGWGRQSMRGLQMRFEGEHVTGSGYDVVGAFTFTGTISAQGHVMLVKRYLGQHTVDYVGTYDGEGLLQGEWDLGAIGGFARGRWLIWIKRAGDGKEHEIAEWTPAARD